MLCCRGAGVCTAAGCRPLRCLTRALPRNILLTLPPDLFAQRLPQEAVHQLLQGGLAGLVFSFSKPTSATRQRQPGWRPHAWIALLGLLVLEGATQIISSARWTLLLLLLLGAAGGKAIAFCLAVLRPLEGCRRPAPLHPPCALVSCVAMSHAGRALLCMLNPISRDGRGLPAS